ncbi:MBL fold metallo-hydrolase [Epibacterium sp. MM17-32]|uniref:MBL fold metallo-hydrolase n=1 Tax=Epibacterium sp. MM17-32 TaxID=2917734 RepID=UPI001EF3EF22|nr:MBL fold metallo-hydrolase [Epibacterium sp. MM17-32]MCG7630494.1 MBL fold metallo-hydrolase [Epibacterium sp. MM17-32]
MKIHQIRNATLTVTFGGKRFLVDPYLAEKDAYPGFDGTVNSEIRQPRVALRTPMDRILDFDALILTHLHPDHFDAAAVALLPRDKPVFVQNYSDAELIKAMGFTDVRPLGIETRFGEITLSRTRGQHGSDQAYVYGAERLGSVMGVVFRAAGEKTLYLAGDTVWNQMVATNLDMFAPDVIVLAAGDAQVPGLGSIIMGAADVKTVHDAAPTAQIIASHMETVNHCVLSRAGLQDFAVRNGMTERLWIPEDDEILEF